MEKKTFKGIIREGRLEKIDISKLKPNPLNDYETQDLNDLKESILAYGMIAPVTVIGPNRDGEYPIIAGEKRWKAVTQIIADGYDYDRELACYVCGPADMNEYNQTLLLNVENMERREYSTEDIAHRRVKIVKTVLMMSSSDDTNVKDTADEITKHLKCSRRYANMMIRAVSEGDPEITGMLENGTLVPSSADALLSFKISDRNEAKKRISDGEKPWSVINDIRDRNRETEKPKAQSNHGEGSTGLNTAGADTTGRVTDIHAEKTFSDYAGEEYEEAYEAPDNRYEGYTPYTDEAYVNDEIKAKAALKYLKTLLKKDSEDELSDIDGEIIETCGKIVEYYENLS